MATLVQFDSNKGAALVGLNADAIRTYRIGHETGTEGLFVSVAFGGGDMREYHGGEAEALAAYLTAKACRV